MAKSFRATSSVGSTIVVKALSSRSSVAWEAGAPAAPVADQQHRSSHLADLLTTIATDRGRTAAANLHASLSGYFGWLVGEGLLDASPMTHVNKPDPGPARDRVPTEDELRALWAALGDDDYGDIVRLIVLCASRRAEIGDLQMGRNQFCLGADRNPGGADEERQGARDPAKPARAGHPPTPATQRARVRLRFWARRFPGLVGGAHGARQRMPGARPDWTLHDFRRMASTTMNGPLKVQPHVVERVLGARPTRRCAIYNRCEYVDEKKAALALWAEYVTAVVGSQPAGRGGAIANRSA